MSTSRELLDLDPEKPKFLLPTLGTLQEASEKAGFCVYVKLLGCCVVACFLLRLMLLLIACGRLIAGVCRASCSCSCSSCCCCSCCGCGGGGAFCLPGTHSSFRWSIGMSEHYLVYAMYAVVCPSGIIRLIPCNCRHIILSQLSFLFHWLIQLVAFFFVKDASTFTRKNRSIQAYPYLSVVIHSHYTLQNQHGTWKYPLRKGETSTKPPIFWGSSRSFSGFISSSPGIIVQVKATNLPVKKPRIGHLEDRPLDFLISSDPSEFTPSSIGIFFWRHFGDPYQSTRCNGINICNTQPEV